MDVKFYRCAHCGNVAVKPYDAGVPLSCCGEPMAELVPNSTEAAVEKHMPQVEVADGAVQVKVGSVEHPMTPEHLIAFICLVTDAGYQIAELTAEGKPAASFCVAEGDSPRKVYEYCNLHGLWMAEL